MNTNKNDKKNASGLPDPTAYEAIKNVTKEMDETTRFFTLLYSIFDLCEESGFHLMNRIIVRDKKSGKIWR